MSNYFSTNLGTTELITNLGLEPINLGDQYIYLQITGTEQYILQPGTKVKAMIVPSGSNVPSGTIIDYLKSNKPTNDSLGYYIAEGGENNGSLEDHLSFKPIKITNILWENQQFLLHWLILRGSDEIYNFNSYGVYCLPHNIQSSEVFLSGNLITGGNKIQYNIKWNAIANENSIYYGAAPNDGPYSLYVTHKFWGSKSETTNLVSGFLSGPSGYSTGTMTNGINITLPVYDQRKLGQPIPAIYNFELANISADILKPNTKPLIITIDHQELLNSNNYFKNLDKYTFNNASKDKLKKIDEIKIDSNIINRKRLSIGINDISIKDNTYVKQGIYISKSYPLDFNIYTFALKVNEVIPNYLNVNPYNIIQYYIEFNSNPWERISPITRNNEFIGDILIPKLFIFDKNLEENILDQTKYLNFNSNINSFRVKIIFDLSSISESKFIPPEVKDYKCIVYDKDQFFNI